MSAPKVVAAAIALLEERHKELCEAATLAYGESERWRVQREQDEAERDSVHAALTALRDVAEEPFYSPMFKVGDRVKGLKRTWERGKWRTVPYGRGAVEGVEEAGWGDNQPTTYRVKWDGTDRPGDNSVRAPLYLEHELALEDE